MLRAHTASDTRAAEAPLLAEGRPLMIHAARRLELAAVRELRARQGLVGGARVVVLVGSGGNGGDGLHAAAGLARRGADVRALLVSATPHTGGLAALATTNARVHGLAEASHAVVTDVVREAVTGADLVIDAVAGIGVTGGLRGVAGAAIEAARAAVAAAPVPALVLAVDVPSGIGVDDGAIPGPVLPADVTVVMGTYKPGLLLPPASALAGVLELVELGLGPELARFAPTALRLSGADVADLWPVPGPQDQKYTRGVLGVLAGSDPYPGAAVLATGAAAALAGMVRYVGPDGATQHVLSARPEVVSGWGRTQAWSVGSGIGADDTDRAAEVRRVLAEAVDRVPVVVDAGGLASLPDRVPASVVLTPHAGELATLLTSRGHAVERERVEADPVSAVRAAVERTGATVLLKGATTLVAGPGTPLYSQADATPWLGTAGAGDVLAGALGALLAGRSEDVMTDPALAAPLAAAAALVHGRAARLVSAGGPLVALDVARALPRVVAEILA